MRTWLLTALAVLALCSAALPAAAGGVAPQCSGTVDAQVSVVPLCGALTVSGEGGEVFDLRIDRDTWISTGACGTSPRDSFYCDLDTDGTSPLMGLFIHDPIREDNAANFSYLWMGEHTVDASGGFREIGTHRGYRREIIDGQTAVLLPAADYRVRLVSDGTPSTVTLRVDDQPGAVTVLPRDGDLSWRDLALEYGNEAAGGMGADFSVEGPTFAQMNYAWTSPRYVNDLYSGICFYEDPTTMPATAFAPGCPDRVTGGNDAFELQYPLLFGGPTGQRATLLYAGDTDAFALGAYHGSLMVGGQTQGYALELPLS